MTQSQVALPQVDPYAEEFQQQPAPGYAALRAAAPAGLPTSPRSG